MRGADVVVETLARAGVRKVFTLSGNHVMPVFDAVVGEGIDLVHVRHEAAAVHMADAWARMTGEVGVALVTGGAGHANAIGALCTAGASESPVLLLSGHAAARRDRPRRLSGDAPGRPRGALDQGIMDRAVRCRACGRHRARHADRAPGRPGPVHVSLPSDVLDAGWIARCSRRCGFRTRADAPRATAADASSTQLAAQRSADRRRADAVQRRGSRGACPTVTKAVHAPVVAMESPRGINDPALGCYAEISARRTSIVLLGKPLDFILAVRPVAAARPAVPVRCGRAGAGDRRAARKDAGAGRVRVP